MSYKLSTEERELLRPLLENKRLLELLDQIFFEEARDKAELGCDAILKSPPEPYEVARLGGESKALRSFVHVLEKYRKKRW